MWHFQGKPLNITVIQVYATTSNAEEAETKQFHEDLQDLLKLTPKKDVLFVTGDWNAKVGSQEIPGVIRKFGLRVQTEAEQRLIESCQENTGHSKHLFQQHKRRVYVWTSPDCQYLNQFDPILAAKDGAALYSQQKQDQELTVATDHELFMAKFRLKLKKVRKTTKPFSYDLNQIPYDYPVEVTNRVKG